MKTALIYGLGMALAVAVAGSPSRSLRVSSSPPGAPAGSPRSASCLFLSWLFMVIASGDPIRFSTGCARSPGATSDGDFADAELLGDLAELRDLRISRMTTTARVFGRSRASAASHRAPGLCCGFGVGGLVETPARRRTGEAPYLETPPAIFAQVDEHPDQPGFGGRVGRRYRGRPSRRAQKRLLEQITLSV